MDKEFKRYWVVMSLVDAVILGIAAGLFFLTPLRPMYPMFIALGLTFALGCDYKKTHNYILSFIMGIGWGLFYIWCDSLMSLTKLSYPLNIGLNTLFITVAVLLVNGLVLKKTWFNIACFAFCGLSLVTSQWGENIVGIIVAGILGILVGVLTEVFTQKILKAADRNKIGN